MIEIDAPDWVADCMHWRHRVLTGEFRHWCQDWDGLPIDETTPEWPCACAVQHGDGLYRFG
jgi:hypothetical protein